MEGAALGKLQAGLGCRGGALGIGNRGVKIMTQNPCAGNSSGSQRDRGAGSEPGQEGGTWAEGCPGVGHEVTVSWPGCATELCCSQKVLLEACPTALLLIPSLAGLTAPSTPINSVQGSCDLNPSFEHLAPAFSSL